MGPVTCPDCPDEERERGLPGEADGTVQAALAQALDELAGRDVILVAVDFDGTLAPIVDDPEAARPLPLAVEAIEALARLPGTRVAVVSGRPLAQLRRLLRAGGRVALVGSHGAEVDLGDAREDVDGLDDDALDDDALDEAQLQLLSRLRNAVADIARAHPGTTVEEKPAAVVLHTRTADREAAAAATREALEGPGGWQGVHVLRGKEVVELAVTEASKGLALQRLSVLLGLEHGGVFFAGDDTTDERAFAVLTDDAGNVTVKVGAGRTAARHRVAGPDELAEVLALLAGSRGAR
jgi:trehalose-phosphatase